MSARGNIWRIKNGPDPATYTLPSGFCHSGPKFSFGKERRAESTVKSNNPGPGAYDRRSIIGTEGLRCSIYGKIPDTSPKSGTSSPGPAAYHFQHKANSPSFSMAGRGHIKHLSSSSPGPGKYNPQTKLLHNASPLWVICKGKRNTGVVKRIIPDPGAYELPNVMGQGPKISFYGRRVEKKVEVSPGPGAYDQNSKITLMNYPGIIVTTGPRTEKDFSTRKDIPGPGTYPLRSTLNGPKIGFGYGKKCEHKLDNSVPGPGAYKVPCTFAKAERYKIAGKSLPFGFV